MTPPLHTTAAELPPGYFAHASTPELPTRWVVAFYQGQPYPFHRDAHGQPWRAGAGVMPAGILRW